MSFYEKATCDQCKNTFPDHRSIALIDGSNLCEKCQAGKIDDLASDYQTWCKAKGLPDMSADELLCELSSLELSDEQRNEAKNYIENFLTNWDKYI